MAKWGKCNFDEIESLQKKMKQLNQEVIDQFIRECGKELAARLLRKVDKRTPVCDYRKNLYIDTKNKKIKYAGFTKKDGTPVIFRVKNVKKGGTLRRGWTATEIQKNGNMYQIQIINPVEYAPYVEFGHRTPNHGGWVAGRFMLSISVDEIRQSAPAILQKKLEYLIKEQLK